MSAVRDRGAKIRVPAFRNGVTGIFQVMVIALLYAVGYPQPAALF
jgi:hypothetical protein